MEEDEILLQKLNHSKKIALLRTIFKLLLIIILLTIAFDTNSLIIILISLGISLAIFTIPGLKKFDNSNSEEEIKEAEISTLKMSADLLFSS